MIRRLVALIVALVVGIIAAGGGHKAPANASPHYLADAESGLARAQLWWTPKIHWYRQFLPGVGNAKPATVWGTVHLFETYDAIAMAAPTKHNVERADAFGRAADKHFWNPRIKPVPAYSPVAPGATGRTWYDDEAWWGVAQVDAYHATHDRRFLRDAARSLRFINSGWDPATGGIWWNNLRKFKASESLAGGTLTAAGLYEVTHKPQYLKLARKYLAWANTTIRARDGLYGARSTPVRPMPYVEGPMAEAELRLCHATHEQSYCNAGERLLNATADHFPTLTMGPPFDALYVRALIQAYKIDHNRRWYDIAQQAAEEALAHAGTSGGLYLRTWDGRPITAIGFKPGKLQVHAATTSVFAWLATVR